MKATVLSEKTYSDAMKSIMRNELFPALSSKQQDSSLKGYNLDTFGEKFVANVDNEFLTMIESDRKKMVSSSPLAKCEMSQTNKLKSPWNDSPRSALFFDAESIGVKAIQFEGVKKPYVNYSQTRFPEKDRDRILNQISSQFYTTDTITTTESETDNEGKCNSSILRSLESTPSQSKKEMLALRKKNRELTEQGKKLLNSLPSSK